MAIVIPNTFRVVWNWTGPGVNAHNVTHFQTTRTKDELAEVLLDESANLVTTHLWQPIQQDYQCTSLDITPLDGVTATEQYVPTVVRHSGQSGGDAMPNSAGVLTLTTGQQGRSRRGRIFMGPMGEGAQAAGLIGTPSMTAWAGSWEQFRTDLLAENVLLCVVSEVLEEATLVGGFVYRRGVGTQRRRQRRVPV